MNLAETEGTGIKNFAETEGTGISNLAETEGTGIRNVAETEGTGISSKGLKNRFINHMILCSFLIFGFCGISMASKLNLHTDSEGNIKGIWVNDKTVEFVEGYLEKNNLVLFVANSLLNEKATDNGTGDDGTGDNGDGDGDKATDNGTGKATDNGTGSSGKATDNGTGKILSISAACDTKSTSYHAVIETEKHNASVQVSRVLLDGRRFGCQ